MLLQALEERIDKQRSIIDMLREEGFYDQLELAEDFLGMLEMTHAAIRGSIEILYRRRLH